MSPAPSPLLQKSAALWPLTFFLFSCFSPAAPIISEFMAANKVSLADEDGAYPDWIEVHNPDAVPVSMAGWRLTDNVNLPNKWVFPAMTLAPGEFRIIFASSKNRTNPAAVLHTNFALSAGGEYLALIAPDGAKSTEFAPAFPPQLDDVSFGSFFSTTPLVLSGQPTRYLVPASSKPATASWTSASYNDDSWSSGASGLGFGLLVPGMTVKEVQLPAGESLDSLAKLDSALNGTYTPAPTSNTQFRQVINYLGDGGDGRFPAYIPLGPVNIPFTLPGLNGRASDVIGIRATGLVSIPSAGAWTFGFNTDDGGRFLIDLNNDGDFLDAGEALIVDDTLHGPEDKMGTVPSLAAGSYRFEFVMFENGGGDEAELFAQAGTHPFMDTGFRLLGDTENGGLRVSSSPDGVSGGSGVIATNLSAAMLNLQPGAYTRSTFTMPNLEALNAITTLSLGMSYNDGFTAWLNGTQIASRNSPDPLLWNSPATASRDTAASLSAVNFNVTAFKSALTEGSNTLAVQGLNVSADDNSFLILPTLTGGSLQAGGPFYFKHPTPGTLNNTPTSLGPVADTTFSHKRGLYTAPFTLAVTTLTPGATLSYTLDGSKPSPTHGILVLPPTATSPPTLSLQVNATRIVRVMAFKENYDSTNIDTNTYLFPGSVVRQASTPPGPGWPDEPITRNTAPPDLPPVLEPIPGKYTRNGQEFDYGMDPAIVFPATTTPPTPPDAAINGADGVKAALAAIPSISISLPIESLTDPNSGIYNHANGDGFAWEREASIEMLNDPNTTAQGFQENCGLRIRGGYSRTGGNPKHAFRILFRREYGAGKLNYPIFRGDDTAATSFDKFDIQTSQNYSWSFGGDGTNTFLRELWCRDTQLALKQPSSRGRFVHLYLNGIYWGFYQIEERPEADFAASYLGGKGDDYDVVKVETSAGYTINPTAGDLTAWTDLWNKSRASYFINTNRAPIAPYPPEVYTQAQKNAAYFLPQGRAADGLTPTPDPVLLNVDNLIDNMLIVFLTGNTDAPLSAFLGNDSPNNFYSIRDRRGGSGFLHIQHDGEHTLDAGAAAFDRVGPFNDPINGTWNNLSKSNPQFLHQDLAANAEYRMRFADLTHRHMVSPHGVLNTVKNQARLSIRAATVESAIMAESARWGDSRTNPGQGFTANTWRNAANNTLNWFNGRNAKVLTLLKNAGLYPLTGAPVFSQSGGITTTSVPLTLTAPDSTIYYTVNGADPRRIGGALDPSALSYSGGIVNTVTFIADGPAGSSWRYLDNGSNQGTAWRASGFDDSGWSGPAKGQFGYGENDETTLISYGPDSSRKYITTWFRTTFTGGDLTGLSGLTLIVKRDDGIVVYLNGTEIVRDGFPAGTSINYLTTAASAGDDGQNFIPFANLPLNLLVSGTNTLAVEIHQTLGTSSDISFDCRLTATRTTDGTQIFLPAGVTTVRARVLDHSGTWSALNEQEFLVNAQPASAANLVVSEIMYHPGPPSPAEITAGFTNSDSFEWIELQNTGSASADLRGAYFSNGIGFTFPTVSNASTLLPPGGRLLLVENLTAFRLRYGTSLDYLIAGQYTGALDNNGERLTLKQPDGTLIGDFAWQDSGAWPADADGSGPSLVLINPAAHPDPALPANWRPSTTSAGNPTTSDATTYAAWKTANHITGDSDDTDQDGLTSFEEYVNGTSPTDPSTGLQLQAAAAIYTGFQAPTPGPYLTFTFLRNPAADDISYQIEQSSGLTANDWSAAAVTPVSSVLTGNPWRLQLSYRLNVPYGTGPTRSFYRLRAVLR